MLRQPTVCACKLMYTYVSRVSPCCDCLHVFLGGERTSAWTRWCKQARQKSDAMQPGEPGYWGDVRRPISACPPSPLPRRPFGESGRADCGSQRKIQAMRKKWPIKPGSDSFQPTWRGAPTTSSSSADKKMPCTCTLLPRVAAKTAPSTMYLRGTRSSSYETEPSGGSRHIAHGGVRRD